MSKLFRVTHKNGEPWTITELIDYMRRVETDVYEDESIPENERFQFHINDQGEIFISNGYETMEVIEDRDDFSLMKADIAIIGLNRKKTIPIDEFLSVTTGLLMESYDEGYKAALEPDFEEKFWEHYSELVQKGEV